MFEKAEVIAGGHMAYCYHRSRNADFADIIKHGINSQGGEMYGTGLYTCFNLKDQFTDYMSRYGEYLIKFAINTENFIDFDKIALMSLQDAILKFKEILSRYPDDQATHYSATKKAAYSDLVKEFVGENDSLNGAILTSDMALTYTYFVDKNNLDHKYHGIIFTGAHDGKVLVVFSKYAKEAVPMAWSHAPVKGGMENLSWNKIDYREHIKNRYNKPSLQQLINDGDVRLIINNNDFRVLSIRTAKARAVLNVTYTNKSEVRTGNIYIIVDEVKGFRYMMNFENGFLKRVMGDSFSSVIYYDVGPETYKRLLPVIKYILGLYSLPTLLAMVAKDSKALLLVVFDPRISRKIIDYYRNNNADKFSRRNLEKLDENYNEGMEKVKEHKENVDTLVALIDPTQPVSMDNMKVPRSKIKLSKLDRMVAVLMNNVIGRLALTPNDEIDYFPVHKY